MGVGPLPFFHARDHGAEPLWRFLHPAHHFSALGKAALAERDRWPLWLPVALAAGVGLYFALPGEPSTALALWVFAAAGLCALAAPRSKQDWAFAALALTSAALLGFAAGRLRTVEVATPVLTHRISYLPVRARVDSSAAHGKGVRAVLSSVQSDEKKGLPKRVRVYFRGDPPHIAPGTWIAANISLMPPPGPAAPGDYDFARWAYYHSIGAVGFAYGKPRATKPLRQDSWLEAWDAKIERLRDGITARIRAVLPGREGGIAAAMITGERGGIDPDDQNAFRNSGLAHILSISGLHLALAGGCFFWIVRALLAAIPSVALRYPIKKWASVAALLGAGFYLLISGCDPPALRSYIMLAMMFLAVLVDRPALTMRAVAIAAALILLVQPESLIDPGFEMSFAAVIGLIALAEWERARPRRPDGLARGVFAKIRRYFLGIVSASIVATLATAPFAIFHFDRSAQYGVLANLASMPIAGFVIMPAATLAMIALPFGLERVPLLVMGKGIGLMLQVAHWVSDLPGAISLAAAWPVSALIVMIAGGLWLALWRRTWRWLGLLPVLAGILFAVTARPPDLMVGRDGETVALREPDGRLAFLRPPLDDYTADVWLKRDGDSRSIKAATGGTDIRCDSESCVGKAADGSVIAAPLRASALAEDCARASIVISARPARHLCEGPRLVIDRFETAREGGFAIWLGDTMTVRGVNTLRGARPWNPPSHKHANSAG